MTEPMQKALPGERGEQYPLLKGGTEANDHLIVMPATGWSPPPKKPVLLKRQLNLSDLFFAFWIALTMFIIGVLISYVFASVYYDVKWSTIKSTQSLQQKTPNNKVTLHYVTGRGTDVPFTTFSEVLSGMAARFPKLEFEVQFYLSDSRKDFVKFKQGWRIINQENRNNIITFVTQHRNIMVEFKPVSELMSLTPLRYIWEYMSLRYLAFYAAVYEVWLNGGIAFDLEILTKKYQYGQLFDKRIETILQRYNDGHGIQYNDVIFDEREVAEAELNLSFFFFDMFEQLINDTRDMFNTEPFGHPLITNRFKRQVTATNSKLTDKSNETVVANKNATKDYTDTSTSKTIKTNDTATVVSTKEFSTDTSANITETNKLSETTEHLKMSNLSETTEVLNASALVKPNKVFLLFTRNIGFPMENKESITKQDLYMNRDGSFLATELKRNPFLSKILLATSCLRITPEYAIEKLYMEQCGAFDVCDKIHIF